MQTATNPQTGETVVLIGSDWKPAEKIATNDKGEKAFLVGGQWVTDSGVAAPPAMPKPAERGFGADLLRQAGLTLRAGLSGSVSPFAAVADVPFRLARLAGADVGLPSQAQDRLLTKAGLPEPETPVERIAQDVAGALTGVGATSKLASLSSPVSEVGQGIAKTLASRVGTQATSAASAAGAAGATREAGGDPWMQLMASVVAGVGVPYAAQRVANAPGNVVASSVQKSEAKPFAQEGDRLANATGIDMTTGARTGNKLILGQENLARQYPGTADRVQDIDVKIANQAISRVNQIADNISARKVDPATLGTQIEDTVKSAASKIDLARDAAAARDYGQVRALAGNQPVIRFDGFVAELKNLIDEYKNVAGADAQKVTAQAKAALNRVTGTVDPGEPARIIEGVRGNIRISGKPTVTGTLENTIDEAMRSRRFYGQAAKGAANVFEDIAPDLNRRIGARLFGAINQDFDNAALNANGALRKALDTANGNYKKFSESMTFLEKSTLGKLVGDDLVDSALSGARMSTTAGEAVVQKIANSHPSTRKAAIDILDRWNPELTKDIRANVLRDALDKGMSLPPSAKGAGQVPISFNRFITALQGEKVGFEKQLESYGFKPAEISDIKDTVQAMMRQGDRTGFNFSNTNVAGQAGEIASAVGSGLAGNLKGAAMKSISIAGKVIGLNKIADAMATAEGRQALRTVVKPAVSDQARAAAFGYLEANE